MMSKSLFFIHDGTFLSQQDKKMSINVSFFLAELDISLKHVENLMRYKRLIMNIKRSWDGHLVIVFLSLSPSFTPHFNASFLCCDG